MGVAAVERAAHATHHRHDLLASMELAARTGCHDAGCFDPEHPGKDHPFGQTETGMELGPVQAKRLNLDQHPTDVRFRDRDVPKCQRLWWPGPVEYDGSHGVTHSGAPVVGSCRVRVVLFEAFQDARAPVRNLPEIAIELRFEGDRCLGTQLRSGGGDFDDRGQSVSEVSVG